MGGSGGLRDVASKLVVILMELGDGVLKDRSLLTGGLMEESVCSRFCGDCGIGSDCGLLTRLSSIS